MSESPAAARGVLKRRRLLAAGVVVLAAAALLAWPWWQAGRHIVAGRDALDRGDFDAALAEFETAESIQPDRAEVHYWLAAANRRRGRLALFRRHLDRARGLGWPVHEVARQEWLAIAQSGGTAAVQEQLGAIIDCGASDEVAEEVYEAMAQGQLEAFRLREAWTTLDHWIQWRPDAPQARLLRATIYVQTGHIGSATDDCRAAAEQLPDHREVRLKFADLLWQQDRCDEAEEQFRACLEAFPDAPEALLGVARCAARRGETTEARTLLDRALQEDLSPAQEAQLRGELGRCLLQQGSVEDAVEALRRAVALAPADGPLHHALAGALKRAGQATQAERHYEAARRLRVELDRLIEIRRRLVDVPGDADARFEAGSILIAHGMIDAGVGWLLAAAECNPRHRKSHQALAEYFAETGRREQAAFHRLMAARP